MPRRASMPPPQPLGAEEAVRRPFFFFCGWGLLTLVDAGKHCFPSPSDVSLPIPKLRGRFFKMFSSLSPSFFLVLVAVGGARAALTGAPNSPTPPPRASTAVTARVRQVGHPRLPTHNMSTEAPPAAHRPVGTHNSHPRFVSGWLVTAPRAIPRRTLSGTPGAPVAARNPPGRPASAARAGHRSAHHLALRFPLSLSHRENGALFVVALKTATSGMAAPRLPPVLFFFFIPRLIYICFPFAAAALTFAVAPSAAPAVGATPAKSSGATVA